MKVERLEPTHPLAKIRLLAVLAVWADFCALLLPPSARIVIAAPSGVLLKLQSGRIFQVLFCCSTAVLAASWVSN